MLQSDSLLEGLPMDFRLDFTSRYQTMTMRVGYYLPFVKRLAAFMGYGFTLEKKRIMSFVRKLRYADES